jgi:hypothetical protein
MINAAAYHEALADAGLPVDFVSVDAADVVTAHYTRALTGPEQATADAILADPYYRTAHAPRPLHDIHVDVNALTGAQMTTIWNDLMSGTPSKITVDEGNNAAALYVMNYLALMVAGLTQAEKTEAKRRSVVMYVQDNPRYLVQPPFDPSINIPGDVPVS